MKHYLYTLLPSKEMAQTETVCALDKDLLAHVLTFLWILF